MKPKKKIAICGTRGVPAKYGGFETFAEELGSRLVERGYEVTVYGRIYNKPRIDQVHAKYRGINCVAVRAFKHKYFETPLHTLFCFLNRSIRGVDLILLCNAANSPFSFIPRLMGIPVVINVDGIERERRKWNWVGKLWYRIGEITSSLFANHLISDANYIHDYYKDKYYRDSSVIRYGARHLEIDLVEEKLEGGVKKISEKFAEFYRLHSLKAGEYILYVSRLEPENNADKVIAAYSKLSQEDRIKYPLVIVGDAPYAEEYKEKIKTNATPEVRFLGYQFGDSYVALQAGARMYIQATEVGGTHPALVEAMGFGNCIIANDVREHREVMEGVGALYKFNDIDTLAREMERLVSSMEENLTLRKLAYERATSEYNWEEICSAYEKVFEKYS